MIRFLSWTFISIRSSPTLKNTQVLETIFEGKQEVEGVKTIQEPVVKQFSKDYESDSEDERSNLGKSRSCLWGCITLTDDKHWSDIGRSRAELEQVEH